METNTLERKTIPKKMTGRYDGPARWGHRPSSEAMFDFDFTTMDLQRFRSMIKTCADVAFHGPVLVSQILCAIITYGDRALARSFLRAAFDELRVCPSGSISAPLREAIHRADPDIVRMILQHTNTTLDIDGTDSCWDNYFSVTQLDPEEAEVVRLLVHHKGFVPTPRWIGLVADVEMTNKLLCDPDTRKSHHCGLGLANAVISKRYDIAEAIWSCASANVGSALRIILTKSYFGVPFTAEQLEWIDRWMTSPRLDPVLTDMDVLRACIYYRPWSDVRHVLGHFQLDDPGKLAVLEWTMRRKGAETFRELFLHPSFQSCKGFESLIRASMDEPDTLPLQWLLSDKRTDVHWLTTLSPTELYRLIGHSTHVDDYKDPWRFVRIGVLLRHPACFHAPRNSGLRGVVDRYRNKRERPALFQLACFLNQELYPYARFASQCASPTEFAKRCSSYLSTVMSELSEHLPADLVLAHVVRDHLTCPEYGTVDDIPADVLRAPFLFRPCFSFPMKNLTLAADILSLLSTGADVRDVCTRRFHPGSLEHGAMQDFLRITDGSLNYTPFATLRGDAPLSDDVSVWVIACGGLDAFVIRFSPSSGQATLHHIFSGRDRVCTDYVCWSSESYTPAFVFLLLSLENRIPYPDRVVSPSPQQTSARNLDAAELKLT